MCMSKSRIWRKLLKKMQRKKRRQRDAKERENMAKEEDDKRKENPNYLEWLQTQAELEECHREFEEREHKKAEDAWMLCEIVARKEFEKRKATENVREALKQQQLLQNHIAQKATVKAQNLAEATQAFEVDIQLLEEYAENINMNTPPAFNKFTESKTYNNPCELYQRTNCCRFSASTCSYNHRRPLLSRILLLRHFFEHPLLHLATPENVTSGNTDERELHLAYFEFFNDVVPELEKYGVILNVRALLNSLPHMRGHVFVEYQQKRCALKAFINLQGRFYDGKKLNIEFAHLTNWRTAVCGFHLKRNCSKANHECNYMHLFVNPDNKYNLPMESNTSVGTKVVLPKSLIAQTPLLSWNDVKKSNQVGDKRNWRWSESPEVELPTGKKPHNNNLKEDQDKNFKRDKYSGNHKKEKKKKKESRERKSSRRESDNSEQQEEENTKKSHKKHKKSKI